MVTVPVIDPLEHLGPPAPRPVRHHLMTPESGQRMSICGLIAPWDVSRCPGSWEGESVCPECGVPYCPDCLRLARG
jgi:hypothetical protein